MTLMRRWFALLCIVMGLHAFAAPVMIHKISTQSPVDTSESSRFSNRSGEIKIALICAPKIIGKYAQSTYNVALATLLSKHPQSYTLKQIDMPDESDESLLQAVSKIRRENFNAVLAPLTLNGARRLAVLENKIDIFIPTVHKRDLADAPQNFTFGSIDYVKQIEALLPYMGTSIAIFYDDSAVGIQLKKNTESLFLETDPAKKSVASYAVDAKGDNIVSYFAKPSVFNKKSIILHLPVVKSSMLAAHMTFTGVKKRNLLSTQINFDPTLISLTQYNDRKNMIVANSIVEHPPSVFEANALMNNDVTFDWINYAVSVGTDDLVAKLTGEPREYSLRIVNGQVIYPVELLKAEMHGFEPIAAN